MIEISDEELQSLNQVILTRYGIDFTSYEASSFKRRIARAIAVFNMNSVLELWARLLKDRDFIYPFIDELTVGLTAMFRDPILWKTLRMSVLKSLSHLHDIHIWHAGCSTGEEVYTMGMVLSDVGLLHKTKALATDINQSFLRKAQAGKYHVSVLDEYSRNYKEYNTLRNLEKYHTLEEDTILLDKKYAQHVEFKYHNLVMDQMHQKFDIIFCRNVMIYFDNKTKLKLLEQFHSHLNEGGFLIIGFYDALMPLMDDHKFDIYDLHAKIFKKIS